jgi:hypothetical protein
MCSDLNTHSSKVDLVERLRYPYIRIRMINRNKKKGEISWEAVQAVAIIGNEIVVEVGLKDPTVMALKNGDKIEVVVGRNGLTTVGAQVGREIEALVGHSVLTRVGESVPDHTLAGMTVPPPEIAVQGVSETNGVIQRGVYGPKLPLCLMNTGLPTSGGFNELRVMRQVHYFTTCLPR